MIRRLRRLQIAWAASMAAFILYSVLMYHYGIDTIIAFEKHFGWTNDATPLFVLPMILPAAIVTFMIRRIRCERCGGRVIRTVGSIFPRKCASCKESLVQ